MISLAFGPAFDQFLDGFHNLILSSFLIGQDRQCVKTALLRRLSVTMVGTVELPVKHNSAKLAPWANNGDITVAEHRPCAVRAKRMVPVAWSPVVTIWTRTRTIQIIYRQIFCHYPPRIIMITLFYTFSPITNTFFKENCEGYKYFIKYLILIRPLIFM